METVTLRCGALHAEVLPEAAGGLGRLDWQRGDERHALLRPYLHAPGAPLPTTSQLACFPLVPWSNRIAPSGFEYDGQRYVPTPNRPGEKVAIHGDGWQQAWDVQSLTFDSILLRLTRHAFAPLAYDATLRYTLDGDALIVELTVRNAGAVALPFLPVLEPRDLRARVVQVHDEAHDAVPQQ